MTFTLLLLALFAERFLLDQNEWRQARWFGDVVRWLSSQEFGIWLGAQYWGALLVLAPPLLLTGWIQSGLAGWLWGLPSFLFALLVLLYCLGPEDLDNQVANYLDAEDRGDDDRARALLAPLCAGIPAPSRVGRLRQAIDALLTQAQERLFAPLFWFLLLGPFGALLYRLTWHLRHLPAEDEENQEFRLGVERLLAILDWLPARILVLTFALGGDFDGALQGRRQWLDAGQSDTARGLLHQAGWGALRLNPDGFDEERDSEPVQGALVLVWRGLILWLAVVALLAITV